jgi:uncharacterized protein YukE
MFDFPNSSAMDATASSGGPSTFLFQIVTGQPAQIAQHSTSLLAKATQFVSMLDEFTKAAEQLRTVWSGQASESAVQKITGSLQSFEKIIQVVRNGAQLLGVSGTLVQSAQVAYRSVVSAVNPTVASLMSNPWTYGAAVALSTATSASLRAFITAIEGLLQALGVARLGAELAALASIVTEIEKLAAGTGGTAATATAGSVPTTQTISASPITAPQAPPPVATAAGQQAIGNGITDYTPPALQGYGSPTLPTSTLSSSTLSSSTLPSAPQTQPSLDPSNSWIAVDPPPTPTVTPTPTPTHVGTPAGTGQGVSVTATEGGITTTVSVPAGQVADISIGADGSVTVSR